ncbi:hypothetical protein PT931_09415, partial [Longispora urticae]
MSTTLLRRAVSTLAVTAVTAGSLIAAVAPAQAAFTSGIDGYITRSEVIERAQYWVDHQPGPYSQSEFSPGPTGDRDYRRDCSGYVDMAWHTGSHHWTGNLSAISYEIPRADLKAGDILNDAAN